MSDQTALSGTGPLFVVMNAGSGDKAAGERATALRDLLDRAGRRHRILLVTDRRRLPEQVRLAVELAQQEEGVVVAAGGDGTINTVAQAVWKSGRPLGLLPQGTFNYFSRSHGIPSDTEQATAILLKGAVRPVQVGLINDRLFLVNASLGLYPRLLEKRETHKQRFGRTRLVALASAVTTLLSPAGQLVLTLEQEVERLVLPISTLLVENNALQLEEVGLPEAGDVRQGQLAAVVVRAQGAWQMLSVLVHAALGRLWSADQVSSFSFTNLTVKPMHRFRIKVATDGEVTRMAPPLVFRVAPHPLHLVVPTRKSPEGVNR